MVWWGGFIFAKDSTAISVRYITHLIGISTLMLHFDKLETSAGGVVDIASSGLTFVWNANHNAFMDIFIYAIYVSWFMDRKPSLLKKKDSHIKLYQKFKLKSFWYVFFFFGERNVLKHLVHVGRREHYLSIGNTVHVSRHALVMVVIMKRERNSCVEGDADYQAGSSQR